MSVPFETTDSDNGEQVSIPPNMSQKSNVKENNAVFAELFDFEIPTEEVVTSQSNAYQVIQSNLLRDVAVC